MANKDGDSIAPNQSKRSPLGRRDSDSHADNPVHTQQQQHEREQQQQQHHQQLPRAKPQKHVVGGGLTRRVPSSKTLHKHHPSASRLVDRSRRSSPSPDRAAAAQPGAPVAGHRRATSDVKLARDPSSSSSNLKKNASQSSLKRNRSHVDVSKRGRASSHTHIKRSFSNPSVGKGKSAAGKTQVQFDLGNDEDDQNQDHEEEQDDDEDDDDDENGEQDGEWVDASASVSPFLSRRSSPGGTSHRPQTPRKDVPSPLPSPSANRQTAQRKEYLTSRQLLRTPPQVAPPKMSDETASARAVATNRQTSPGSDRSRDTVSTLSGTPQMVSHAIMGSSGKEAMTSRFVTASRTPGSIVTEGSFYAAAPRPAPPRAVNGKADDGDYSHGPPRRPRSLGELEHADRFTSLTDDEVPVVVAPSSQKNERRTRRSDAYAVPPAEFSRTQQKLNLERASSTLEPTHRHHQGPAAGALLGGAGYDTRDPRVGKLLERTGMEYLVVRRYQNPVVRSLARLAQLPGADKGRRIPTKVNGSTPTRGHVKRNSDYGNGRFGLSQSFRERDSREIHSSGAGSSSRPPVTPRGAFSVRTNGAGSSADTDDDGGGRLHEGLSGSSLVDGEEDDGTVALLRNLWEKNLDLSASQD